MRDDITAVLDGARPWTVAHARAEDMLAALPNASIDLILTDPPYFSTGKAAVGDKQWRTADAFLAWLDGIVAEYARVLKPNGSLYLFCYPDISDIAGRAVRTHLNLLSHIVWIKAQDRGKHKQACKEVLRNYFPNTERIIFAEHYGSDNTAMGSAGYDQKCDELRGFVFEPIRAYLDGERKRAGIDKADCNVACGFSHSAGGMASRHYFSTSQWCLPTAQHYAALQRLFNAKGRQPAPPFRDYHPANSPFERFHASVPPPTVDEYLRADYEDLRADYEDLRADYEDLRADYEDLRRPFSVTADVPYTDVWDFPTVGYYPGKHQAEKPAALLEHVVAASSRPGAVVLDTFAGSGATGVACAKLGRRFIGCDMSEHWAGYAATRIEAASRPALAAPQQLTFHDSHDSGASVAAR